MIIGYTGHRDKVTSVDALDHIAAKYPDAAWVHGGAKGFDTFVESYAQKHNIQSRIIKPDYTTFGKSAPHIRNREIVNTCDILVACYDNRTTGGTYYTVTYAKQQHKPVIILSPI